jgi:hypothetical protein
MKSTQPTPNIAVKPNIWCSPNIQHEVDSPDFLQPVLPGDLLVEFLGTRDNRIVERELSRRQLLEFKQSRFFQHHGQTGLSFDGL